MSKQETPNMGHRHSLTIETNPLHLLPSNMRRFSQADQLKPGAVLSKLAINNQHLPKTAETPVEKKEEEEAPKEDEEEKTEEEEK